MQYCALIPACLAAEYPPYLRYDGMHEERYTVMNEYGGPNFMDTHIVRTSIRLPKFISKFSPY